MRSTISLLGLYNYDNSILEGLTLPDNFDISDTVTLKNNLLMETAEFELLYSDPIFLKFAITAWANKNRPTWKWLKDTQLYEYNPIWNADYNISDGTNQTVNNVGTHTNRIDFTRNLSDLENGSETKVYNGESEEKHSGDTTTETKDHIVENEVSAYNQLNTLSPESRNTENGKVLFDDNTKINNTTDSTETTNYQKSLSQTGTTNTDDAGRSTDDTSTVTSYSRYLRGNYGQTSTQQLINEEQELAKFNVIDYIITDFKKRFCLMIY